MLHFEPSHQLAELRIFVFMHSKVGNQIDSLEMFGQTRCAPCWNGDPHHPPEFSFLRPPAQKMGLSRPLKFTSPSGMSITGAKVYPGSPQVDPSDFISSLNLNHKQLRAFCPLRQHCENSLEKRHDCVRNAVSCYHKRIDIEKRILLNSNSRF